MRHRSRAQIAGSLRVGDQQLIEIAKALSLQSDILIMDEPTSALTEAEVEPALSASSSGCASAA